MASGGIWLQRPLSPSGVASGPYQFSSEHQDLVQHCFADGAVRPLSTKTSLDVLQALGGVRDGAVPSL